MIDRIALSLMSLVIILIGNAISGLYFGIAYPMVSKCECPDPFFCFTVFPGDAYIDKYLLQGGRDQSTRGYTRV